MGQLGRQDQAVAVLEPAFRRWPENAEIGRNLATALSQLGRFAEAAAVLDPLAA
ncbi:MAG: tetratricopeptide repeat protein, partial [Maritimibacter sp.]|nr:tetratricopeptide repeat protein [Maritimibacter sp.]